MKYDWFVGAVLLYNVFIPMLNSIKKCQDLWISQGAGQ
jgi:hypothetical protein